MKWVRVTKTGGSQDPHPQVSDSQVGGISTATKFNQLILEGGSCLLGPATTPLQAASLGHTEAQLGGCSTQPS